MLASVSTHPNTSLSEKRKTMPLSSYSTVILSLLILLTSYPSPDLTPRYAEAAAPSVRPSSISEPNEIRSSIASSRVENTESSANLGPPTPTSGSAQGHLLSESPGCNDISLARLPGHIRPQHYELLMAPDMDAQRFAGVVRIQILVGDPASGRRPQGGVAVGDDDDDELERLNWAPELLDELAEQPADDRANREETSHDDDDEATSAASGRGPGAKQVALHADGSLSILGVWLEQLEQAANSSALNELASEENTNRKSSTPPKVVSFCQNVEQQILLITLSEELPSDSTGVLEIEFQGTLSDDLGGFYKSNTCGKKMQLNASLASAAPPTGSPDTCRLEAITQFQAVDARRAFPCFDEPAFKATFDLIIGEPRERLALANTQRLTVSKGPLEGWAGKPEVASNLTRLAKSVSWVRFARTPPMSSYLLAFALGQYQHLEARAAGRLPVRVYTPPGRTGAGQFALETAIRALPTLEQLLGINYSLEKLDLVSVSSFQSGAMENWGLVTFRESQLLLEEQHAAPQSYVSVASTVVHELAHQWFGNLLTMSWWNGLWLNEGFATWLEYKVSNELFPGLQFELHYLLDSHVPALIKDSTRTTHEVQLSSEQVQSSKQIEELFDSITYNKAAAIIRWLENELLGADAFKSAIRNYLSSNKFGSSNLARLWRALERELLNRKSMGLHLPASVAEVRAFLSSWLRQPGYPLLEVRMGRNNQTGSWKLHIKQQRFLLYDGLQLEADERAQLWHMPLSVQLGGRSTGSEREVSQSEAKFRTSNRSTSVTSVEQLNLWLSERDTQLDLPAWFNLSTGSGHFVKLNRNYLGFYRVNYVDRELFEALERPLSQARRAREEDEPEVMQLAPEDRVNLIDDLHALVLARRASTGRLVQMLTWLRRDSHPAVWLAAIDAYNSLRSLFEDLETQEENNNLQFDTRSESLNQNSSLQAKLTRFGVWLLHDNRKWRVPTNRSEALTTMARNGTSGADFANRKWRNLAQLAEYSALSTLVQLEHRPTIRDALALFEAATTSTSGSTSGSGSSWGHSLVAPHLRRAVYSAVARHGSETQFGRLFKMFEAAGDSSEERERIAHALARATSPARLERVWAWLRSLPDAQLAEPLELLETMLDSGGRAGLALVGRLLSTDFRLLSDLNRGRPLISLLDDFCLALGSRKFARLDGQAEHSSWPRLNVSLVSSTDQLPVSAEAPGVRRPAPSRIAALFARLKGNWRQQYESVKKTIEWRTELALQEARPLGHALDVSLNELYRAG